MIFPFNTKKIVQMPNSKFMSKNILGASFHKEKHFCVKNFVADRAVVGKKFVILRAKKMRCFVKLDKKLSIAHR